MSITQKRHNLLEKNIKKLLTEHEYQHTKRVESTNSHFFRRPSLKGHANWRNLLIYT